MNTRGQGLIPARLRATGNKGSKAPEKFLLSESGHILFGPHKNRITKSMIIASKKFLAKRAKRAKK